jgi:ATP-dependent Clp protease ATP-binding subunit ClpA
MLGDLLMRNGINPVEITSEAQLKAILQQIKNKNQNARNIKNVIKTLVQVPLSEFIIKNQNIEKISTKIIDKQLVLS